jgi:lipoprotein-releasing system ATP-binding protein
MRGEVFTTETAEIAETIQRGKGENEGIPGGTLVRNRALDLSILPSVSVVSVISVVRFLPVSHVQGGARMSIHLSAAGLEKSYHKGKVQVPVLRGVDLEVEHGELLAIVGASGSGKSTLLHVLGLLDEPDAGAVWLEGERIDDRPDRRRDDLRNRTFGFIFQFYHLLPELTALENVMMPQLIRHGLWSYLSRRGKLRDEANALLERVGLGHRLDHKPAELSGGEMQRAAIARALCGGPSVLLADEPTGNLDAATGLGVLELLRDLNRERAITMILVTHDAQIAQQADRVVRLAEGRIEEWSPALA